MPNQLAQSKRRASLAEHEAVLAALATIARQERTSVMDLLREGARQVVRSRAPAQNAALQKTVLACAPKTPARFKNAAHAARFKRAQREFDAVVQELNLVPAAQIQQRNSLVDPTRTRIRVLAFEDAPAA